MQADEGEISTHMIFKLLAGKGRICMQVGGKFNIHFQGRVIKN